MKRNFLFLLLSIAFAGYAQAQSPTTLPVKLWTGLNPVFADLRIETSDGKPRTFYTVAKEFHLNLGDAVATGTNEVVYKFDKTGFTCPTGIRTTTISASSYISTWDFQADNAQIGRNLKVLGGGDVYGKLWADYGSGVPYIPQTLQENSSGICGALLLANTGGATSTLTPASLLNLYKKQTSPSDSWQISFSGNVTTQQNDYKEYVHLQTTKATTGISFAIRTLDNSGAGQMTTRLTVNEAGNVLIGGSAGYNNERLFVDGVVKASSFKAAAASFPDYVFESAYKLRSIEELSTYIQSNKKLPGMPSEQEVLKQGLDLSQVSTATVEKVEELSLYIIQLNERIKALEAKLAEAGK